MVGIDKKYSTTKFVKKKRYVEFTTIVGFGLIFAVFAVMGIRNKINTMERNRRTLGRKNGINFEFMTIIIKRA